MRLINADTVDNYIVGHVNLKDVPTVNAIPVSENATNGDMIKALFPSCETRQPIAIEDIVEITLDRIIGITVTLEWWNAPYKRSE